MNKFAKVLVCSSVITLSACTTTKQIVNEIVSEAPDYSNLYLRGSFSWWEADEEYKVVKFAEDVYRVKVDLVADGQPYDFKFADKDWSKGLSCGYLEKESDEVLTIGKEADSNCDTPVDNFIFVPEVSGTYIFQFDASGWAHPKVSVIKI